MAHVEDSQRKAEKETAFTIKVHADGAISVNDADGRTVPNLRSVRIDHDYSVRPISTSSFVSWLNNHGVEYSFGTVNDVQGDQR